MIYKHKSIFRLVSISLLIALMLSPVYAGRPSPSSGTVEAFFNLSTVAGNHTIISAPQEGAETDAGLMLYYRFNNDSAVGEDYNATNASLIYDYSGHGNHGVGFNLTYNRTGKLGGGWEFNKIINQKNSSYIAIQNLHYTAAGNISELTICVWFKTILTGTDWRDNWAFFDFDRSENFNFFINGTSGRLGFSTSDSTGDLEDFNGTRVLNDGLWHFGCAVYDGTAKILYADGIEDARQANPHGGNDLCEGANTRYGFVGVGSEALTFNGDRNDWNYNGTLDEIRFYHRALSAEEIKGLYLGTSLFKHNDNLVFHSGNATMMYDVSGWSSVWHHVLATWENSSGVARLYVDSSETNSTGFREGGDFGNYSYVGSDWRGDGNYTINGTIDEVRVLNRSFSPAEVKRDFLDQNESGIQLSRMDYDAHSNYTSQVFDLGSGANFTTLRWVEEFPYGDELGQDENSTAVLILHMDDYVNGTGQNVTDSSGLGNNEVVENK